MNKEMQTAIEAAYKVIVLYREALTNAFLEGHMSMEVKMKADLFYTANFLERVLTGQQQLTDEDANYIDRECAELDLMCRVFPAQFQFVKPQLEAVGKAFEVLQNLN